MGKLMVHSDAVIEPPVGKNGCSARGHVWVYAGRNTVDKIPEGLTCLCGNSKLRYIECYGCGKEMPIAEPIEI